MVALAAILVINRAGNRPTAVPSNTQDGPVLRADSHRIATAPGSKVTVVEFLDFECPSCGAAYPSVKQMLDTYQGRITVVVRYFPIASHPNGHLSARAAQAAANQGMFPEMYAKLFENQGQWSEQAQPQTAVFLTYARELGLDMDRFAKDLDDPATAARVAKDQTDGTRAGVTGTPTFFVNGRKVSTFREMTAAIDAALAS